MARIWRLDLSQLQLAEVHARRLSPEAQKRQIRTEAPVTWLPDGIDADPLALEDRYRHHVDGAFIPKGDGRALHMLVKFPSDVPVATREDADAALALAVDFARSIFGDEAVFAARMDRDETSFTNADLFIAPRYVKKTKHTEKVAISLSRDLKRMAERRGGLPNDHTVLAAQGSALQDEFASFLRVRGYQALRGQPKQAKGPDWFSPEAYGVATDREIVEAGREAVQIEREDLAQREAHFEESSRQQKATISEMAEGAAAKIVEADLMLADAARARTESEELLSDAIVEEARVASHSRAVADVADYQARQAERLRAREKKCRQEEERIAGEASNIAKARDALSAQADALARREMAASAREEAADDRETALARVAGELSDQTEEIDRTHAATMAALAEAERAADAMKQTAAAELDRARQSALAGFVAGEQMALIARAVEDDRLELRLADDERGVSMTVAAMTAPEREAYQQPWSKMVRELARAVATMLSQLRDRIAAVLKSQRKVDAQRDQLADERKAIASEQLTLRTDREKLTGERFLAKQDTAKAAKVMEAVTKALDAANAAAKAWTGIPEDRRSPEVAAAMEQTGLARQAASLINQEAVRAKTPDGPTGLQKPTSRPNER